MTPYQAMQFEEKGALECKWDGHWAAKPTLMLPTMNDSTECVHFQKPFSQFFNELKGMKIEMCTFSKTPLKYLMTIQFCGLTLIMNGHWGKRYILIFLRYETT